MRNTYEIIIQIKDKIPKGIEYDKSWLDDIVSSAKYQPPESKWIWNEISSFVNELVPYPPKEKWHKEIVNLLLNEEKY